MQSFFWGSALRAEWCFGALQNVKINTLTELCLYRSFRGRKDSFKQECNVREIWKTVKYSLYLICLFRGTESKRVQKKSTKFR